MRLVLSGYYGFNNVGDEAILYSIISALREANSAVHITVLSNDPEKTAKEYGVEAVNRWKLKEVARVIRSADGVISGGGSLLQDKTGNRSVIYYSGIMWIAKLFRKPYFVYAQGIGPLSGSRNQQIVRRTLEGSKLLTVRDQESKELLEQIGIKKTAELVPDPVLGFVLRADDKGERIVSSPYVAVSVRDWPSEIDYKKKLASSLDEIARDGYAIVFIPMHGEHDAKSSAETADLMKEKAIIAPHDGSIMQKVKWIAESELLIGMRLHALIFAAVGDTPFVALSYDPKIDSFAKLCKQPVAGHVNVEWDENKLVQMTKEQLANKEEAVEQMLIYTKEAKQKAKQTAVDVLKHL
ncbi:polysaccharide pyruvyl transferase CsaB [Halalkalibacter nanhaiisediminis]|uniref:Polysaccharide pyruvyl transferase CsaB n=1 Tax=Halalkalibacter nanhaiisediminis TaxID=688079 RepID=A0A562QTJ7_9BACI|nr:polysaccharide pyruvyl transferase CsaB [Halalkalibacter nanhaiisediminis]TWI59933.1 polysaccharide pyruvyl transferase CsaB [Halalkalibacter nanhaiisediminis]